MNYVDEQITFKLTFHFPFSHFYLFSDHQEYPNISSKEIEI